MSDLEGGAAWAERKQRIRDLYWAQLQRTPTVAELLGVTPEPEPLPGPPLTPELETPVDPPAPPSPTTPATPGDAITRAAQKAVRSARAAWSRARGTSATPATATAPSDAPTSNPPSGTPAATTNGTSSVSTVWQGTPLGFIEQPSSLNTAAPNGSLAPGLPPRVQRSLEALATGRSEPVEAIVQQIAEFYVENEDEHAEGPLVDALTHYCDNYTAF